MPKSAHGRIETFPRGYAVTVPAFTEYTDEDGGTGHVETPMEGFVSPRVVLGDYDYGRQQVRARAGTVVTIVDGRVSDIEDRRL